MPERAALGASGSPVFMAFPKLACGISAAEPGLNVLLEKAIIVQGKLKKILNEIESKQVLCPDAVQHDEVPMVTHAHTAIATNSTRQVQVWEQHPAGMP